MEEIAIVRKRTRVWPIVLALVVVAVVIAAVWYLSQGTTLGTNF